MNLSVSPAAVGLKQPAELRVHRCGARKPKSLNLVSVLRAHRLAGKQPKSVSAQRVTPPRHAQTAGPRKAKEQTHISLQTTTAYHRKYCLTPCYLLIIKTVINTPKVLERFGLMYMKTHTRNFFIGCKLFLFILLQTKASY